MKPEDIKTSEDLARYVIKHMPPELIEICGTHLFNCATAAEALDYPRIVTLLVMTSCVYGGLGVLQKTDDFPFAMTEPEHLMWLAIKGAKGALELYEATQKS